MALAITIEDLLKHNTVESERIEYKKGMNPEPIVHSMCAFTNDIHNWGGGYILIGVDEVEGEPVLPPEGVKTNKIDKIQKKVFNLSNKIMPRVDPIIDIQKFDDKNIVVIYLPTGQSRPYQAPKSLSNKNQKFNYYIRKGSNSCIANRDEIRVLNEISSQTPFDDRINYKYKVEDIKIPLVNEYLNEIGSDLVNNQNIINKLTKMNLIDGPPEDYNPKNIALMMFNPDTESIFPKTQIDVVYLPEGDSGDTLDEKIFKGPIHKIIKESLNYIDKTYLKEKNIKQTKQAESKRVWNYPYNALKESIANAIYHRSYEIREPVEIRIYNDRIIIINRPGPDRSISDENIRNFNFISRSYRNNRIGDFLKELRLTEGRGTGIPKILRELEKNESPPPIVSTNEGRNYFMLEIPINEEFLLAEKGPSWDQVGTKLGLSEEGIIVLRNCQEACSLNKILDLVGRTNRTKFRNSVLKPLLEDKLIRMTIPDKPRSSKQKYIITKKGKKYLRKDKEEN